MKKMQKDLFMKGVVIGILLLFVETNIVLCLSESIKEEYNDMNDEHISISTLVDAISPYEPTSSQLTINASGDSDLDNVTLFYRFSNKNTFDKRVAFTVEYGIGYQLGSWDVTDPNNIVELDSSAPSGTGKGMYLWADSDNMILYVTWYNGYVSSYNISDPENIVELDKVATRFSPNQPWHCILHPKNSNYLYIGSRDAPGCEIYNVSDPSNISYIKTYNGSGASEEFIFGDQEVYSYSYGDFLYSGDYLPAPNPRGEYIIVYNITDPENWVFASKTALNNSYHSCIDDHYNIFIRNDNFTGLRVINISDPAHPTSREYLAYNTTNKMKMLHWQQVFYDNISNTTRLFLINFIDNALIMWSLSYTDNFVTCTWDSTTIKGAAIPHFSYTQPSEVRWHNKSTIVMYCPVYRDNGIATINVTDKNSPVEMDWIKSARTNGVHDIEIVDYYSPAVNSPADPPTVTGPISGKVQITYPYNFFTLDPEGNNVSYYIDWGDNTNSGWLGPYASGETITVNHAWLKNGTYTIKAKAKDCYGSESDWGELIVIMPYSYNIPLQWFWESIFERFPHVFPILQHLMSY